MGIYTDIILKKEENNIKLEQYADESLKNDTTMQRIETDVEDAQTTILYLLDKFGITASRHFGCYSVSDLLESLLDSMGMMYDYSDSVVEVAAKKTEYILAFREDGKAVALFPSILGYRWFCPFDSQGGMATKKFCQSLKNHCYIFNRPLEEKRSIILTFIINVLKYLTVYDIIRLIVASMAVSGLGLIIPRINKWIYNVYLQDSDGHVSGFQMALVVYILVSLARVTITSIKSLMLSDIKIKVSMKVQSAVMAKVLHLPHSFFVDTSSGKLSKRINSCSKLSDLILNICMDVLLDFSFSGIYLVQMKHLAPELYKPAILFLAVKIILSMAGSIFYTINETRIINVDMENSSFLYSAIRGIQKIKSMGAENFVYAKWADMYRRILKYDYNQPFFLKYQGVLINAVSTAATITLMWITCRSGLTKEDYMTFSSSYVLVISVVTTLTDMMQNIFLMKTLTGNVNPIFRADNEQDKVLEYVRNISGRISIDNVYFKYRDSMRGCLDGVSLDIKSGEKIAIVGESGCGKSTLLKILLGMEMPDEGTVYYDNKSINTLNLKSLRRCIGSVFQFSKIFPGTISSNVTFTSQHEVTEEEIWDAVDKAAIGDYIRTLPLQLDTEISESNSCGFSGGQRQRILLARALLNNPSVLILDEATSALDNVTQNQVLETINNLKTTVIMVAHRLSTVVNFDRIVMLEGGKIVEDGTYSELIEKKEKFAELVKKQLLEDTKKTGEGVD